MALYEPVQFVKLSGGVGMAPMLRLPEALTQTFKRGAPLSLTSGYLVENAFGGTVLTYGFALEDGHNLTASGVSEPASSEGTPPNQASAKIIAVGARMRDGRCGIVVARDDTVFSAMLTFGQVFTQALVIPGTRYQLVKDGTTGFYYIDSTATGTGDEHLAEILGVDPSSPNSATLGARVFFKVTSACRVTT